MNLTNVETAIRNRDTKIADLQAEIKRLEGENRWIPVSERLPEKEGYCFVCDGQWCGRLWWDNEWEFANKTKYPSGFSVTHWKPIILPKGE